MPWINRLSSRILRFLALQLRNVVQRRTASALAQLDDRALAVIGVPRQEIADYARDLAYLSVPMPAEPAAQSRPSTLDSSGPWHPDANTCGDGEALADAARS